MIKVKRLDSILSYVAEQSYVSVGDLAESLNVSKETIRRDLKALDSQNKLMRQYGGASRLKTTQAASSQNAGGDIAKAFYIRTQESQETKIKIAKKALRFVNKGECIVLDNSSTSWFLAKQLPDIKMTVITSSLEILNELACRQNIRIIGIGGEYSVRHNDFNGPIAEETINSLRANKLFLSCDSLDINSGVRDGSENNASLKRTMLKIASQSILMADYSKLGNASLCEICSLGEVDYLISDLRKSDVKSIRDKFPKVEIIVS